MRIMGIIQLLISGAMLLLCLFAMTLCTQADAAPRKKQIVPVSFSRAKRIVSMTFEPMVIYAKK